jgi:hypothetical protein
MKKALVFTLLPVLLGAFQGCKKPEAAVNPAATIEELKSKLDVRIESFDVKPRILLPLAESGLDVDIILGISNPVNLAVDIQSFAGVLSVVQQGRSFMVGDVASRSPVSVAAKDNSSMRITRSFRIQDFRDENFRNLWRPGANIAVFGQEATWKVDGSLTLNISGGSYPLPISVTRTVNSAAGQ